MASIGADTRGFHSKGEGNELTTGEQTYVTTEAAAGVWVRDETPSGAINGSNVTFTLANTPISGSVVLWLNGLRLRSGAANDFTVSGVTITMNYAPASGDSLISDYRK